MNFFKNLGASIGARLKAAVGTLASRSQPVPEANPPSTNKAKGAKVETTPKFASGTLFSSPNRKDIARQVRASLQGAYVTVQTFAALVSAEVSRQMTHAFGARVQSSDGVVYVVAPDGSLRKTG